MLTKHQNQKKAPNHPPQGLANALEIKIFSQEKHLKAIEKFLSAENPSLFDRIFKKNETLKTANSLREKLNKLLVAYNQKRFSLESEINLSIEEIPYQKTEKNLSKDEQCQNILKFKNEHPKIDLISFLN